MHGHEVPCVVDVALQDGLGDLAVIADGVAFTLGIHGDLDVLGNGGVQDIVEVADDAVAAGFRDESVEPAVGSGIGFAVGDAAFQFVGLFGDGFFLFRCSLDGGESRYLRLKDQTDVEHVEDEFVVVVDKGEPERVVGDTALG